MHEHAEQLCRIGSFAFSVPFLSLAFRIRRVCLRRDVSSYSIKVREDFFSKGCSNPEGRITHSSGDVNNRST